MACHLKNYKFLPIFSGVIDTSKIFREASHENLQQGTLLLICQSISTRGKCFYLPPAYFSPHKKSLYIKLSALPGRVPSYSSAVSTELQARSSLGTQAFQLFR